MINMHFKISFWLQWAKGTNSQEVMQITVVEGRATESFCNRLGKGMKQYSDGEGGKKKNQCKAVMEAVKGGCLEHSDLGVINQMRWRVWWGSLSLRGLRETSV